MNERYKRLLTTGWIWLVGGILLGALIVLAIRYVTYKPADQVHYHANFAVYINGQRQQFKGPQYYQEVQICSLHGSMQTPAARAHMHDNVNDVVHIHDNAVTWGQFFNNLGWYIGPDFLRTSDTMYLESGQDKLHIMLNGQDLTDISPITNTVIKDQDKLLVSFGNESSSELPQEYKNIPSTAHHYDVSKDPSSCSGAKTVTLKTRLQHLF